MDNNMQTGPIKLTLDLNKDTDTATAVAVAEAPAPIVEPNPLSLAPKSMNEVATSSVQEYHLTPQEEQMVNEFAKKIDISDSQIALNYGSGAQKNISDFSESALNSVKTKDTGEIGEILTDLMGELQNLKVEEKKGIAGWFARKKNNLELIKANYDTASANIDKVVQQLESHQIGLMKDIALLDNLYDLNKQYLKELTMYIIAGKKALDTARETTLEELRLQAAKTGLPEDAQAYNDFQNLCIRFEKRLHDLEITRVISIQMAPQTRMIQNNDVMILEKIQSSIANTIPLWKSQIVLALGIEHSRQAIGAVSAVNDMTNELLKRNAETLKMGTIEVAQENEKSIVSIDSLKYANEQLISTIDEVMQIQINGAKQRKEAEVELARIEGQLKQKLLELRNG